MSDLHHERFDLSRFVLDYLAQQGSVVAPPAFATYEVLMPEEVAAELGVDDFLSLRFDAAAVAGDVGAAVVLSVNHPIVDKIAALVAQQPANAAGFINHVRLDKRGLVDLARKRFGLPNARVDFVPKTQECSELHHYLQFNFKATILSEEKQEDAVSVTMDVQSGYAVAERAHLDLLALVEAEARFDGFPLAPPRWTRHGEPLAAETLQKLLVRAEAAARTSLAPRLAALATRMEHHLALDLARINQYYDELAADLRRRQGRVDQIDAVRRQEFDDKLAMIEAERRTKTADVSARYGLRIELELINTLLITQPKVTIAVNISNRTTTIQRTVIWDPLMHRLEALVCDVCGQPSDSLQLCSGGHLAHDACLAPQCVDCKRIFCRRCADAIKSCVVCGRPVCRHSLISCSICGRGSCREHQGLCHAAEGQPAVLASSPAVAPVPTPKPPKKPSVEPPAVAPAKPPPSPVVRNKPAPPPGRQPTAPAEPVTIGVRIDVQIYEDKPMIVAFVMRSTKRVLAKRMIELTPQGLLVSCHCEKSNCAADGYYYRPAPSAVIDKQVGDMLLGLQKEYLVPGKKVHYLYVYSERDVRTGPVLVLPAVWLDPVRLTEAERGFSQL